MGFPLLTVESAGPGKVKVTQSWFLADGSPIAPSEEKSWAVPIFVTSRSTCGTTPAMEIFREKSFEVAVPGSMAGDWLQVNAGYLVPARVRYSSELLTLLAQGIR